MGVNAWVKPLNFFVSIGVFAWTMGWYLGYLGPRPAVSLYTWMVVGALAFELLYIVAQAACGQRSHFNVNSPLYAALFAAMGLVIVALGEGREHDLGFKRRHKAATSVFRVHGVDQDSPPKLSKLWGVLQA